MTTLIRKRDVGRVVDFRSSRKDDALLNGRIEKVKNGTASIRYHVVRDSSGLQRAFSEEGFVAYLNVRDERIIEIY